MLRATGARYRILAFVIGLVLYETCVYAMLGRRVRKNTPFPILLRYGNALLETSVPTIGMLIFARSFDPVQALISLAPYMYFLFIILAALRLEFWLCIFTAAKELLHHHTDTSTSRQYVCVMFIDIRGFTAFAEQRSPEDTVSYLNTMFAFMIQIINEHNGIVHQLLGDGMMAIFGAPVSFGNDSENAVRAATSIIARLQHEIAAGRIPPTRLGIGLHAGEVVAGTVGSSLHKEYKVTGDVVNLVSRIEQLNKDFDSQLLISGEVLKALSNSEHAVRLGPVVVRGREEPVEVYALAM